mmetsp:Transcript_19692/g.26991  ORF Transcript_19692/g.26991 Transcript_19692/m.26991 type:complete len:450 (+) Transcript_19692:1312-2661(+)
MSTTTFKTVSFDLTSLEQFQPITECTGTITTELESEYGVCLSRGFVFPVEARPVLIEREGNEFKINDIDTIQYDPTKGSAFLDHCKPLDPIFLANIAEEKMVAAEIISGRSSIRFLMSIVSPQVIGAFYSKRKAFQLLVEKIGTKLIIKTETVYPEERGGFGRGFDDAMTTPSNRRVNISDMDYFRVVSYTLGGMNFLISHEVDCVHPISNLSIELKSSKIKRNKRTGAKFELEGDFYINVWRQMVLSGTSILKIGRHEEGKVVRLVSMNIDEVRIAAGISPANAKLYFGRLVGVLRWISSNVADGQQALIDYRDGGRALELQLLPATRHRPLVSQFIRDRLSSLPPGQPKAGATPAAAQRMRVGVTIPAVTAALTIREFPLGLRAVDETQSDRDGLKEWSAHAVLAGAPPLPPPSVVGPPQPPATSLEEGNTNDADVDALADSMRRIL